MSRRKREIRQQEVKELGGNKENMRECKPEETVVYSENIKKIALDFHWPAGADHSMEGEYCLYMLLYL